MEILPLFQRTGRDICELCTPPFEKERVERVRREKELTEKKAREAEEKRIKEEKDGYARRYAAFMDGFRREPRTGARGHPFSPSAVVGAQFRRLPAGDSGSARRHGFRPVKAFRFTSHAAGTRQMPDAHRAAGRAGFRGTSGENRRAPVKERGGFAVITPPARRTSSAGRAFRCRASRSRPR